VQRAHRSAYDGRNGVIVPRIVDGFAVRAHAASLHSGILGLDLFRIPHSFDRSGQKILGKCGIPPMVFWNGRRPDSPLPLPEYVEYCRALDMATYQAFTLQRSEIFDQGDWTLTGSVKGIG
jgi:hypothetical protein